MPVDSILVISEKKIEIFEKKTLCLENFEKKWKQESFEKKRYLKKK